MRILRILTIAIGLLGAVAWLNLSAHAEELKVGQEAPDFSLRGSDGKTYTLSQFKGKKAVIIAWYPKANTSGCTAECKSLRDSAQAIDKYDVAYFAASVDKPEANLQFSQNLALTFPLLSDPTHDTAQAYGVMGAFFANRWTFYIDKDGKVALVDKKINTATAGQDLQKNLEALKIPKK